MTLKASIAANRFGYGANIKDINLAKKDPVDWLINQLKPVKFNDKLPGSAEISVKYQQLKKMSKKDKTEEKNKAAEINYMRSTFRALAADSIQQAIVSEHSVSWRLLDFFSNHFSVTAQGKIKVMAPTLEREAIAPNLFGNFEDILLAVVQHPVMLIYLNNEVSFGPQSKLGKKRNKGLNENLAREIMELHTLGVKGGYNQQDVTELARGITGWSVKNPKSQSGTRFVFRAQGHQPGSRHLLGKKYASKGVKQGKSMLLDLARHPSTAKFICYKLAHHFISDNPQQSLVDKLVKTWQGSNGNVREVMITLIKAEESWHESAEKFKTPREFVISSFRAFSRKKVNDKQLLASVTRLGQKPFDAGSPAGFSDEQKSWDGSSALIKRIDWSALVSGYQRRDVKKAMITALSESVSEHTYKIVSQAESKQQAYTLLMMSPEFQRR